MKLKPGLFYDKRRKSEDIELNQMVRRVSQKFKNLVECNPTLEKSLSLSEKRVSFGGVETDGERVGRIIFQ